MHLKTLEKKQIDEIKSMQRPPDLVKLTMEAVCTMLEVKPEKIKDPDDPTKKIMDFWGPSKGLLQDTKFIQRLKDYDKDNIKKAIMKKIRDKFSGDDDFTPEKVKKASA